MTKRLALINDDPGRMVRAVLARSGDRGMSFEEIVRIQPSIGSRRTIWKELKRGIQEGEYRKEPPEVGRGRRGRWYLNPPGAAGASKLFGRLCQRIQDVISNAQPREDIPIKAQAQELADMLHVLSMLRGLTLADLLAKSLKMKPPGALKAANRPGSMGSNGPPDPQDVAAIRYFLGRIGYVDEAFDDATLLLLLDRRPAAERTLEIFQRRLDEGLGALGRVGTRGIAEQAAAGHEKVR
jgi:hypothetical protein